MFSLVNRLGKSSPATRRSTGKMSSLVNRLGKISLGNKKVDRQMSSLVNRLGKNRLGKSASATALASKRSSRAEHGPDHPNGEKIGGAINIMPSDPLPHFSSRKHSTESCT
jgi:hypothetical protein